MRLVVPLFIGKKKNPMLMRTRNASRLFHILLKKYSGPIAIILKISSTKKIQTITSSIVWLPSKGLYIKKIELTKASTIISETISSKI